MPEHEKTIEEVVAWECAWGDCGHDECPTTEMEVCLGCSDLDGEGESDLVTYRSWEASEREGHPGPTTQDVRP